MADDAKTIGNDAELEDIAKMSIDIQLLDFGFAEAWEGMEA